MTHIDVPALGSVLLEDVASILSDKELQYQQEHPEAGVVVYHLIFHFLIAYYEKGQGIVWDYADVELTTTQVDAWQAYQEAEAYIMETYEPIELYFLGMDVVDAYIVNVPHEKITELPQEYWYDWEGALESNIEEIEPSEDEWE
ncbi:MAG: hypothetical protein JHC38_08845 [Thiotrichales bacterium]|jgi:hypothetical protein|nr:hypothetical protein [Thiotrichales bacterium]